MITLSMETEPGQIRALKTLENYVSSKKINQTWLLRRQKKMSSRRQANVIWVLVESTDIIGPPSPP